MQKDSIAFDCHSPPQFPLTCMPPRPTQPKLSALWFLLPDNYLFWTIRKSLVPLKNPHRAHLYEQHPRFTHSIFTPFCILATKSPTPLPLELSISSSVFRHSYFLILPFHLNFSLIYSISFLPHSLSHGTVVQFRSVRRLKTSPRQKPAHLRKSNLPHP